MRQKDVTNILVILIVIIFAIIILNKPSQEISESLAKCIGENSEIYVQLGCHACTLQEEMFGENYKYLNITDCYSNREECINKEIEATPTWIIGNQKYRGVQSIEKLQELTGC